MTKQAKKDSPAQKAKEPNPGFTLSDADNFYLAAARRDDDKLAYVAALLCKKNDYGKIMLSAVTEVYAFATPREADVFYGAVKQMIAMNKLGATAALFNGYFVDAIKEFDAKTK